MKRIHRSQIKNAPYNPRKIDDAARSKLTANLRKVGLVAPSTWNERTGNLVGGHQRQACLDALEGTADYWLDVAAVEMDEATERTQNVFLNNSAAQGDWDRRLLAEMLTDERLDLSDTGFDALDLQVLLADSDVGMFSDAEGLSAIEELKAIGADKTRKRHLGDERRPSQRTDNDTMTSSRVDEEDTETYATVVFMTRREREIFVSAMGADRDSRYVDGKRLLVRLNIDPTADWAHEFRGQQ